MKNIKLKPIQVDGYMERPREEIRAMQKIICKFATEDGFDEYCEADNIKLIVGTDEVKLHFDPQTWEATERFLMHCIVHAIESDREYFDEFPYYKNMADRYAERLGAERFEFE